MDITSSPEYRDIAWAFELNRFALELIGLWPKTNENATEKFKSALRTGLAFTMITFVTGVPLICAVIRVRGDIMLVVENLQVTLPVMVVALKLLIMRRKRSAVLSIITMVREDWMDIKVDEQRDVMIRQARIARFIATCEYSLMGLSFTVAIILPSFDMPIRQLTNLTDRDRMLPLQSYYYYDTDISPLFELTFIAQAVTVIYATIAFSSIDSFLGFAIFHICGQLENFKLRLLTLTSYKNFTKAFNNIIVTHLRLIKFLNTIDDTYTFMMLAVVISFAVIFCLFGFLLLTMVQINDENKNISLPQIFFIIAGMINLFVEIFLYCAAGELLSERCEAIYRAIYDTQWYTLQPKKAKNLILLIIRTGEPFRITAGKMVPLKMTTFCSLLKTSAGYVSFLLTTRG